MDMILQLSTINGRLLKEIEDTERRQHYSIEYSFSKVKIYIKRVSDSIDSILDLMDMKIEICISATVIVVKAITTIMKEIQKAISKCTRNIECLLYVNVNELLRNPN